MFQPVDGGTRPTRAVARSTRGMVASPHAAASSVGLDVLRRGGTAIDAAIAANGVLAVVYPASCGIGGDALAMVYEASSRRILCYNGSGRAAASLDAERLRALGHRAMPQRGALTVTVPGAVRAWEDLVATHGRMGLDELLAPAQRYADEGFVVTDIVAESVARNVPLLEADGEAAALLLHSAPPSPGTVLRNPPLARSLEAVRSHGAAAFYSGAIAAAITSTLQHGGNPMTEGDLAAARTDVVAPLALHWRGGEVLAHPPNSQGAVALLALGILDDGALRDAVEWHHWAIEALKIGFDVRDASFADPVGMRGDVAGLLRPPAMTRMRSRIDPARARRRTPGGGGGGTIAVVAVDGDGNAISLIQSLFMGFGSGIVAHGTGIFLHNRGAYFSLDPGHPNALAGGRRPLHTLAPGMLVRAGRPEIVYGTMGGDGQVQTHVQLLHAMEELHDDVQSAIDRPRFVYGRDSETDGGDVVRVESRMPAALLAALHARGHRIEVLGPYENALGHAHAIAVDHGRGTLAGGADPRADSAALGL